MTHALRSACDGVLVGVETVLRDDPRLTVRLVAGSSPVRVVLDRTLRTPPTAALFDDDIPVVLIAGPDAPPERARALRDAGARIFAVAASKEGVDLAQALAVMAEIGLRTVLVEGGSRVLTSFLDAEAADRVIVSIAPVLLGSGIDAVADLGSERIADALQLRDRVVRQVGDDVVIAGTPVRAQDASSPASLRLLGSASAGA